jgi:hypothetical protein
MRRVVSQFLEFKAQAQVDIGIEERLEAVIGYRVVGINEVILVPLSIPEHAELELIGEIARNPDRTVKCESRSDRKLIRTAGF